MKCKTLLVIQRRGLSLDSRRWLIYLQNVSCPQHLSPWALVGLSSVGNLVVIGINLVDMMHKFALQKPKVC
uniref:Carbon catabolite repressor protein 4 homolog 4 n=1 Tax=Rhizophora mucronata TaxID=61149 RepID=A0A2P2LAH1_RHIMU